MVVRQIKVGLLLGITLLLILTGVMGALMRPAAEPDRVLPSRFGDVVWNHEQHARMREIVNCQVCHHKETQGTMAPRPCRHCHEVPTNQEMLVLADLFMEVEKKEYSGENGPPVIKAMHAKCIGCHRAVKAGPTVCRDCHEQSFSGPHGRVTWDHRTHSRKIDVGGEVGVRPDCVRCHHQDEEAVLDGDFRPCGACHKPAATMGLEVKTDIEKNQEKHQNAKHGECETCHTEFNPENDPRNCQDCHQGWVVDTEKVRPSLEQAVHQRCMECHNENYSDLLPSMPTRCADCHRPDPSFIDDPEVGPILWDHERHARHGGEDCDKCHHTDLPREPHMACRRCHGTGLFKNPSLQEALSKRCLGCHKENELVNGLLTWESLRAEKPDLALHKYEAKDGILWWDHLGHAIGGSFSCRECHHTLLRKEGQAVTAARAKKDTWPEQASHIQTCRNCHGPDGPVPGSVAEGTEAPKLDDAFKTICVECHVRLEGGPQTWGELFRVEPLRRPVAVEGEEEDRS